METNDDVLNLERRYVRFAASENAVEELDRAARDFDVTREEMAGMVVAAWVARRWQRQRSA